MAEQKLILLCNNKIAIPALKELLFFNHLSAIIVPERNKDLIEIIKELTVDYPVPLHGVGYKNFKEKIKALIDQDKPLAVLLMTFPFIIPEDLLTLPAKGFINFHYGRLPEYRGPEPVYTQVRQQEQKPALSVHVVTNGLDAGPVIMQETVKYDPDDTYGMLQAKLADAGAKMVSLLVKIISYGNFLPSLPQDESKAGYHKKPTVADLTINWQQMDSAEIKALVNACNPWNKGCGAMINGQMIGITEVEILEETMPETSLPGTIIELDGEKGMLVYTLDNKILRINILYTEEGFFSRKRILGKGFKKGDRFS